jgi:hypothetical protein
MIIYTTPCAFVGCTGTRRMKKARAANPTAHRADYTAEYCEQRKELRPLGVNVPRNITVYDPKCDAPYKISTIELNMYRADYIALGVRIEVSGKKQDGIQEELGL